jgi:hypothetical protein
VGEVGWILPCGFIGGEAGFFLKKNPFLFYQA